MLLIINLAVCLNKQIKPFRDKLSLKRSLIVEEGQILTDFFYCYLDNSVSNNEYD